MNAIELLVVFVPIIGLLGYFAVKLAQIIIRKDVPLPPATDPRVDVLEREVNELRAELGEMRESVTFTQQLLNKSAEAGKLPPAR
ncbi:MAG TPA: hypothetical protein VGI83_07675 [Gemmatimonadales bacterium]|jgi:hypothetical protein